MNHLEKIELIERYYFQQLTDEELQDFNSILDKDPAFKQEVEEYCNLYEGFDALHQEAFFNQLTTFEAQYAAASMNTPEHPVSLPQNDTPTATPKVKFLWNKRLLSIAAVFAVMLSLFAVAMSLQSPKLAVDKYFAQHSVILAQDYRNEKITEAEVAEWKQIAYLYNSHQFAKVLPLLERFQQTYYPQGAMPEEYKLYNLYVAVCQLSEDKLAAAKEAFRQIIAQEFYNNDLKQEAEYMLALVALKEKNYEVAMQQLESIVGKVRHNYKQQAIDLMYDILVSK